MNDELKAVRNLGAELGAVKAENEKLRGLLNEVQKLTKSQRMDSLVWSMHVGRINAALSQQAEPTDTYTAVEMDTAAAQGFRDGQAAVEPATAQNEREAVATALASADWPNVSIGNKALIMRAIQLLSSPAQAEQQPAVRITLVENDPHGGTYIRQWDNLAGLGAGLHMLYAAPIAQTAPQPEPLDQRMLDHFTCRRVDNAGGTPGHTLYFTKMGAHHEYQLYRNEAAALHANLGKALSAQGAGDASA